MCKVLQLCRHSFALVPSITCVPFARIVLCICVDLLHLGVSDYVMYCLLCVDSHVRSGDACLPT